MSTDKTTEPQWLRDEGNIVVAAIDAQATHLTIACGISVNLWTGEVTIPDGLALTDASREFWLAMRRAANVK